MNENKRLNLMIILTILISVALSVSLSIMLIMPREGQMGPPGPSEQGIQGEQGPPGPQGPPGESIVGPMGPPCDPAFSWIDLDSIDVVWEFSEWEPEGYHIGGTTFNITESVWLVDIVVSQKTVVPTKVVVSNTNREEGIFEWSTEKDFIEYRMIMIGSGEYVIFIYGSNVQRIDIIVGQVID